MRRTKKIQALAVICILSLMMSLLPASNSQAANITIEYSQSLDNIVAQLNNKLGIQSTAANWTFQTNATAEITCTSFVMYYNGKPMQMLSMLKPKYQGTDAYNIYEQYMAEFAAQESGTKYCPISGNRMDIPEKTVDKGEVYYDLQTPMQFQGTSRTIIKYAGTLRYTSFLDTVSVGTIVSMQCNGATHSVRFVDKIEASAPSAGEEGTYTDQNTSNQTSSNTQQGTSGNGNSYSGGPSYSGNTSTGAGITKIEIFDSVTSDPNETQTTSTRVIPGRTSISSEQILQSTIEQVQPTEGSKKKDETKKDTDKDSVDVSQIENAGDMGINIDEIEMEEVLIESDEEPVFYVYELEEITVDHEGLADTVCTASLGGIAGIGLIRLIMLFLKLKK